MRPLGRGVVHGVLDQVAGDVVDLGGVEFEPAGRRVGGHVHAEALVADRKVHVGDDPLEQRRDVGGGTVELFLPGVEPRQPQQVLHQPLHAGGVALDDLQEAFARLGVVRVVEQRFRVALDCGERRAQFVGDVGDEIPPDLVGTFQVGDVVEHEDGASAGRHHRREPGHQVVGAVAADRQLEGLGRRAGQHLAELLGDTRVADRFHVRPPDGVALHAEHPPRRLVHHLQFPGLIHHQHAFDHAAENRLHPGPVARQRIHPPAQLAHRARRAPAPRCRGRRRRSRAPAATGRRGRSGGRRRRWPGPGPGAVPRAPTSRPRPRARRARRRGRRLPGRRRRSCQTKTSATQGGADGGRQDRPAVVETHGQIPGCRQRRAGRGAAAGAGAGSSSL